jgi:hypothetical protein
MARCKYCKQPKRTYEKGRYGSLGTYQACATIGCPGMQEHHHTNTFGNAGGHQSWDHDRHGNVKNNHFVDDGYPKGNPRRHPFDKKKKW